jgi:hypothetical protein
MTDDRRRTGASPQRPGDGPIPSFDLYGVLDVRPEATQQEIREAVASMDRRLQTATARQRGGSTARQKRFNIARHWLLDLNAAALRRAEPARGRRGRRGGPTGGVRGGSGDRGEGLASWLSRP